MIFYIYSFATLLVHKWSSPPSHKDILRLYLQCFIVSTVKALQTPMINASMVSFSNSFLGPILCIFLLFPHSCFQQVMCDRHYGGINYPVGGVGGIAKSLAKGLVDQGSEILYKANVTSIIVDQGRAVSSNLILDM